MKTRFVRSAVLLSLSLLSTPGQPPIRPNPRLTPGAVFSTVTAAELRRPGYARRVRDVTEREKRQVYAEYGITHRAPREYEVDHLIPLELGGSNDLRNLWPQSYLTRPWNAHVKDRLEDRLHAMVVDGDLPLQTAQRAMAADWIAAYRRYVGPDPAAYHRLALRRGSGTHARPARAVTPARGAHSGLVWVNTRSGIYWQPGIGASQIPDFGGMMSESSAAGGNGSPTQEGSSSRRYGLWQNAGFVTRERVGRPPHDGAAGISRLWIGSPGRRARAMAVTANLRPFTSG